MRQPAGSAGRQSGIVAVDRDPASFRDPAGFVYSRDGRLLRQVDRSFAASWEALTRSRILDQLVESGLLLPFEHAPIDTAADPSHALAVLRPEPVDFISYPYEWTFGELKDAARLTLDAQARAVEAGFRLRDASAYNVQFRGGRPILIDTLSFEPADPADPWPAYRQFCEHFVTPLALMAHRDLRCGLMLREHIDGIPVGLAARLLPTRTRFSVGLGAHVHMHARAQGGVDATTSGPAPSRRRMSRTGVAALLDSLRRTIDGLDREPTGTSWAEYSETASYATDAMRGKEETVRRMLEQAGGSTVWDLGANVGHYSRIASALGRRVVAMDSDPAASERHYRAVRAASEDRILPLVVDLTNPSPSLGWAHLERRSLADRANADVVMALALIHHVAIGANVPLDRIASYLARLAPTLIIEFVPRSDPMVKRLLATREDIFRDYTPEGFACAFERSFVIREVTALEQSERTLYLMERR
jgi:hypothetical protein